MAPSDFTQCILIKCVLKSGGYGDGSNQVGRIGGVLLTLPSTSRAGAQSTADQPCRLSVMSLAIRGSELPIETYALPPTIDAEQGKSIHGLRGRRETLFTTGERRRPPSRGLRRAHNDRLMLRAVSRLDRSDAFGQHRARQPYQPTVH